MLLILVPQTAAAACTRGLLVSFFVVLRFASFYDNIYEYVVVLFLLLVFVLSLTYIFWEAQPFFVLFLFSSICFLSYNMYARRACRIKSDIGTALLTTLPTFLPFFYYHFYFPALIFNPVI